MIASLVAAVCLAAPAVFPVDGRVTDWFRPPACGRCAGNRGLEVSAVGGSTVLVPVTGNVEFVGPVGGVNYVVVAVSGQSGLRAVLGGVERVAVARGDLVTAGQRLGTAGGAMFVGFRVGPRRDNRYLDPAPLFGLSRRRARLVAPESDPVSLPPRPSHPTQPEFPTRHCSVLPPVVASARGPGP